MAGSSPVPPTLKEDGALSAFFMGVKMNIATITSNQQTMTSKEMAALTEKRHDSVKRTIESLVEKGLIGQPQIVDGEKSGNNVVEKLYAVCKRDSYVVVAQLSPEFTARLVDRWQELEEAAPKAFDITDARALRDALLNYSEQVIELQDKIEADAPKVAFAKIIRDIDGVVHIGKVAKAIGIGPNKLFAKLKADKILMDNRIPYQKYIDKGYFTVIEQEPYFDSKGVQHATFTAMVTGAGQVFIAKRYVGLGGAI